MYLGTYRSLLGGIVITASISTVQASGLTITSITPIQTLDTTELRVAFNNLPSQPTAYQLEKPARLILDFPKTQSVSGLKDIAIANSKLVKQFNVVADTDKTRLTIDLKSEAKFSAKSDGNNYVLKISPAVTPASVGKLPIQAVAAVEKPQALQVAKPTQGVSKIDFQRSSKGDGQVLIGLLDSNTPVDVQQKNGKIIVRLVGAKIPLDLVRRLNVNDFATLVSGINSFNDGSNGVIEIQNNGSFDYMAYQTENKLIINVSPKISQQSTSINESKYTGKKVSLDFQDIEVRRVLQLLADFSGVNIIAADSVQGNITLRLKDVPYDQALDVILNAKNLAKKQTGNVVWISPITEMIKYDEDQAKRYMQSATLVPLVTEYIQLNYAKASEIFKLLKNSEKNNASQTDKNELKTQEQVEKNSAAKESENQFLISSRGSVVADERTNTIIINETPQKIEQIQKLIKKLDSAVKQVMVEARIVRASTDFSRSMGIKWGYSGRSSENGGGTLYGSTINNVVGLRNNGTTTDNNLNVDLGSTLAGSSSIAFGLLNTANSILNLELSALQSDGLGEVLSTPKVMTGDKQEAVIRSGAKVPYTTSSANNGTTTTFQDAVLELKVTPSITPDGSIQMKLNITKDTLGILTEAGYAIDTNMLQTNVLVGDGETVVLGGLYENTTSNGTNKVPVLGDIPVVGNLFKNKTRTEAKRELLIFITPRIVNDTF
ncbi:type IV pilus secretin PilQ family protein [Acinetobacter apis]|uniref:Type IV pilus assembly protein PilQ n=1 Tax=Acinetobacter apis TaxID=1229165 RepID=A0A217EHC8_9GAMM|nr:type IV pilus secretin PilQ [Acinetobacter apis]SNQ29764.1 type IV pilus assembly protein PilQ [Acinetobacter apis]